jgi:hypothetical protein
MASLRFVDVDEVGERLLVARTLNVDVDPGEVGLILAGRCSRSDISGVD